MKAFHKNQTWKLTTLPEGKRAISLKWVFKLKFKPNGSLLRRKSCVVAKGYAQQEGVVFDEIFSPVA